MQPNKIPDAEKLQSKRSKVNVTIHEHTSQEAYSAGITGGRGDFPHCGCRPHVIHDAEVSALFSAPRYRPPLPFFVVRPLT